MSVAILRTYLALKWESGSMYIYSWPGSVTKYSITYVLQELINNLCVFFKANHLLLSYMTI